MATIYTTAIQKLYVAYFNRPADFAGLAYWDGVVAAKGGDTTAVSAAFAAEKEYKDEYASLTSSQIITKIYQNLFGKSPDTAGKDYWVERLDNKTFTIDKIVAEVAGGALGSDKVAYTNKVTAAEKFTNALTTDAQKAGYTGAEANAAAKEFISGVTTDATLAAAIAPAALEAAVAAVIKAGEPFSLAGALADLMAANEAKADFLADIDEDADETTVSDAVTEAQDAVDALVVNPDYNAVGTSAGTNAALLQDQIDLNAEALVTAQTALEAAEKDADDAEISGLSSAVTTAVNAAATVTATAAVVVEADNAFDAAFDTFETLLADADDTVVVDAFGQITYDADGAGVVSAAKALIVRNASGSLVLGTGVTETAYKGVTKLLAAAVAQDKAHVVADAAVAAALQANLNVEVLDNTVEADLVTLGDERTLGTFTPGDVPTFGQIMSEIKGLQQLANSAQLAVFAADDADKPTLQITATAAQDAADDFVGFAEAYLGTNAALLAVALTSAQTGISDAEDDIAELAEAIADLDAANAVQADLDALEAAITAAGKEFTENDYTLPVTLDGSIVVGSSDADIFVAGDASTTIVSFGTEGDDVLFVGTEYTLNNGALSTGKDSVLEAFLIQKGNDVEVTLETKAFGSSSSGEAEIKITLTGVSVADLVFTNGIITL